MSMFFVFAAFCSVFLCFHDHASFQIKSAIIIEDILYPNYHQKSAKSQKTLVLGQRGPGKAKVYETLDPLRTLFYNYVKGKSATNPSFLAPLGKGGLFSPLST